MAIEAFGNGGVSVTGGSVRTFQLLALASAVSLEAKGLKRRGRSATSIAKETTGLRTRDREKLIARLKEMADENEALVRLVESATKEGA